LHDGNVFVTTRPEHGINIKYILPNRTVFEFKNVIHCARLFDFDRSYAMDLGKNDSLNDKISSICSEFHQCNRVIKGKDIAQVVCFIARNPYLRYLIWLITDRNGIYANTWRAVLGSNCYLEPDIIDEQSGKTFHLNDDVFESIHDYPVILNNLYNAYLNTMPAGSQKWTDDDVGVTYKLPQVLYVFERNHETGRMQPRAIQMKER